MALWLALVLRWNCFVLREFLHCSGFTWFHLLWGNCLICVCDIVWSRIQRHGSYWENGWKSWVNINFYAHWFVHEPKYLKHYDLFDIFLIWNLYILLSCRFSAFSSTFNTFFTSFMTVSEKTQIKIKLNIMLVTFKVGKHFSTLYVIIIYFNHFSQNLIFFKYKKSEHL